MRTEAALWTTVFSGPGAATDGGSCSEQAPARLPPSPGYLWFSHLVSPGSDGNKGGIKDEQAQRPIQGQMGNEVSPEASEL